MIRRTSRGRQASPPLVAEQRRLVAASITSARTLAHARSAATAGSDSGTRRCTDALPPHDDGALVEVDRRRVEAAQLADPQPRAVQDLQHGVVATAPPAGLVLGKATLEQRVEVATVEHPWQPTVAALGLHPGRRVGGQSTGPHEPAEVPAQRGGLPGDAAPRVLPRGEVGEIATDGRAGHRRRILDAKPRRPLGEATNVRGVGSDRVGGQRGERAGERLDEPLLRPLVGRSLRKRCPDRRQRSRTVANVAVGACFRHSSEGIRSCLLQP